MIFSELLQQFLSYLTSERNCSLNTQEAYRRDLMHFASFMERKNKDALQADPKDIRKWLMELGKSGLKRTSIARKLSSLRSFYKFLIRSGTLDSNPAEPINFPLKSRPLPKSLTVQDMAKLLDVEPRNDFIGIRDQAIKELLYSTGIRVSELTGLNMEDVVFSPEMIKVTGKGKKQRIVPFGQKAKEALQRYMQEREAILNRLKKTEEKALFINSRGGRLSQRSVQRMISRSGWEIAINHNLTPHVFRHSMATHLLESGADLRSIQKLLGHASVATTQVYTNLDVAKLQKIFSQCHPHSKRK